MSDNIQINGGRIERVVEVLSCASVGAFDDALQKAQVESQDDFGMLEEALRLVITELRQARVQSDETMEALERSRAELEEKLHTIESQRLAIADLSAPILDLWEGVVTLPVIGAIDTRRAVDMTERLLRRLSESGARCAIIDLTGVEMVDSMTADHVIKMIKAAQLLGCYCVVTGIGPEVARTLVELDVDLGRIRTLRNLKSGLQACFDHLASRGADRRKGAPSHVRSRQDRS